MPVKNKKEKQIIDEPEKQQVETPVDAEQVEQELKPVDDIFYGIEGIPDPSIKYYIYRVDTRTGKDYYSGILQAPCSVQELAGQFGGGTFKVVAKNNSGQYIKQTTINIDTLIYPPLAEYEEEPAKADDNSELKFLEKLRVYKELFGGQGDIGNSLKQMQELNNFMFSTLLKIMQTQQALTPAIEQGGTSDGLTELIKGVFQQFLTQGKNGNPEKIN